MRSVLSTVRAVLTIVLVALIVAANAPVILAYLTDYDGGAGTVDYPIDPAQDSIRPDWIY